MDTKREEKGSKRKSHGTYSAAYGCHNARGNCTLSMFRFPKDEERYRKWVQNTRRDDIRNLPSKKLYNLELCSNHFEDSQFMNKETKNKLIWNAVPTLFDVKNPPPKVTPSRLKSTHYLTPIQTASSSSTKRARKGEDSLSDSTKPIPECDTPHKEKLKRKVQALKTKLWRKCHPKKVPQKDQIKSIIAQLKEYLPLETVSFIERQLALHEVPKAQHSYAVKDKMMALSIFYQSRKAYNLLSRLFVLPSK